MKTLCTFAIACMAICSYASDTLTRSQIYSFSVGDTLDYKMHYHNHYSYPGSETTYDTIFYNRMVVSDIFYSSDSLVKYIARRYLFPSIQMIDTIKLSPPEGQEIILDTPYMYYPDDTMIVSPLPTYLGQKVNLLRYFRAYLGYDTYFAEGLGICLYRSYGGVHYNSYNDSTQLIYYSGANGVLGTPYTEMPVANAINQNITDVNASAIQLTVLTDNTLNIQIANGYKLPALLQLFDMWGQIVFSVQLQNTCTISDISGLAKGVYVWCATNGQYPIVTGKVICR